MANRDSCQIWISTRRTENQDLEAIKKKIAKKIVAPMANGAIAFRRVGKELYLTSYYDKIFQITNNLDLSGQLPIAYEDPTDANDGIAYVRSVDFFKDDTVDLIAVVSQARHLVRIYNRSGDSPVAQIGLYDDKGNVADNKLNEPRDCLFLPNGNLLVVSRYGRGANGTGSGHVSEYDQTGSLVASRLEFSGDGESALGKNIVKQPTRIKLDPTDNNYLWVAEYEGRLLKVNLTSWLVEDMIFSAGSLESFCFLFDGRIAIASIALGGIGIIDPETKELVSVLDPSKIGGTREVRDAIELEPGFLGVTCWTNRNQDRGAYILPVENRVLVNYESLTIPENYELARDRLPMFYEPDTNNLNVPLDCLDLIRDELTIPLRKIC